MKLPNRQIIEERIRESQVFITAQCPLCGDKFEVNHSKWFLPCKNIIRCVCKAEYLIEIGLGDGKGEIEYLECTPPAKVAMAS